RERLANSPGCLRPCNNFVTANFRPFSPTVQVGETLNFTNQSTNANRYEWLLDGQIISNDSDLETFFFNTGEYRLTLVAYSNDPTSCRPDSTALTLKVECNIEPDFAIAPPNPLPGERLFLTNQSTLADEFEWYVNGELVGTERNYDFVPPSPADYTIELLARSQYCETKFLKGVSVGTPQPVEPAIQGLGLPIWLQPYTDQNWLDFRDLSTNNIGTNDFNHFANVAFGGCGEPVFAINFANDATAENTNRPLQIISGDNFSEVQVIEDILINPTKDKVQLVPVPTVPDSWYLIYEAQEVTDVPNNALVYTTIQQSGGEITVIDKNRPILDSFDDYIIGMMEKAVGIDPINPRELQLIAQGRSIVSDNNSGFGLFQIEVDGTGITTIQYNRQATAPSNFDELRNDELAEITISNTGSQITYYRQNAGVIYIYDPIDFQNRRSIKINDLRLIPIGEAGGLQEIATVIQASNNFDYPLAHLSNLKTTILDLEFSPNGDFLYIVGDAVRTPAYIGQIDLTLDEPTVRLNFTDDAWFYNPDTEQYNADPSATTNHVIDNIENSFTGQFYFRTANSNVLYGLPEPNALLPQSLVPTAFNWATDEYEDIELAINTPTYQPNLPEQIDGYNYLNFTETPFLITRTDCELNCEASGKIYLQFAGENLDSFDLVDCPTLVSTCLRDDVSYDLYDPQTGVLSESVLSGGIINYPPGSSAFNFLDIAPCGEVCFNGLDDDGDGLVDCFDNDCCGSSNCVDFYADVCGTNGCGADYQPDVPTDFMLRTDISGTGLVDGEFLYMDGNPVIGDLDGDGTNEIIIPPNASSDRFGFQNYLTVLRTDTLPYRVEKYWIFLIQNTSNIAIADLDRNGKAEILIYVDQINSNNDLVCAMEMDDDNRLIDKWNTTEDIRHPDEEVGAGSTIGVADFNQDGISELYIGDNILVATLNGWQPILSDLQLAESGSTRALGLANIRSIAADVLPQSADCPSCDGLELVIGNHVIAFTINTVTGEAEDVLVRTLVDHLGGWTSIADVDLDGDLDAIIIKQTPVSTLTYWDIQNENESTTLEFPVQGLISNSQPVIGEVNGDGIPDIIVHINGNIEVFNYTNGFTNLWTKRTIIPENHDFPLVLYDFNNDKKQEILTLANRNKLSVFDATSPDPLLEIEVPATRDPGMPIIADLDQDGDTEIFFHANTSYSVQRIAGRRVMP
ncbi:MAG: FG-GAP repeat domain-containing protein, partial [Saprospiraceae bacterium]